MADDSPITRQVDFLRALRDEEDGSTTLFMGWRGEPWVMVGQRPVRMRVWERCLERGDVDAVGRYPGHDRKLVLTEQGLRRIEENSTD